MVFSITYPTSKFQKSMVFESEFGNGLKSNLNFLSDLLSDFKPLILRIKLFQIILPLFNIEFDFLKKSQLQKGTLSQKLRTRELLTFKLNKVPLCTHLLNYSVYTPESENQTFRKTDYSACLC